MSGQQQIWTKVKPFYDSMTWARLLQEREKETRRAGIAAPVSTNVPPATTHPLAMTRGAPAGLAGSGQVCLGTHSGVPENWSLLSLLDEKVPASPTRHLLGEPWHHQPSLLPSPAVPVWRRAAGDPVRPYIFQKQPFACQQEDSTLIVTQESLISWEKTLIAASSAPGCRWHGFHQHASGTSAICFQFWMSKCLTGEVLGNAFFPLHLLIWLSKNGKKTSREIREEVWGLNNLLTDSIPLQKLGILLA